MHIRDLLLLDIRAHAEHPHAIRVPQVVAQVQLVEIERHDEVGEGGRLRGVWAGEGYHEVGPAVKDESALCLCGARIVGRGSEGKGRCSCCSGGGAGAGAGEEEGGMRQE